MVSMQVKVSVSLLFCIFNKDLCVCVAPIKIQHGGRWCLGYTQAPLAAITSLLAWCLLVTALSLLSLCVHNYN